MIWLLHHVATSLKQWQNVHNIKQYFFSSFLYYKANIYSVKTGWVSHTYWGLFLGIRDTKNYASETDRHVEDIGDINSKQCYWCWYKCKQM